MKKKIQKINKGMATIELLVAFAILLINVTSVVLLVQGGQSLSLDSETNQEALAKAEQQMEKTKSNGRLDFNLVNSTSEITEDIYKKHVEVKQDPSDLFSKTITSIVNWDVTLAKNKKIKLVTKITNPDAVDGGDTCSSVLVGNWSEPLKFEYEFGADIVGDNSSIFPVTSIQTFNKKMYVTVNNDIENSNETFFILDISDPENPPIILGKLDNSPQVPSGHDISEGLNAVAVDGGNYAYVANAYDSSPQNCIEDDNCSQLQVIDIKNPSNLQVVKDFKVNSFTTGNKLAVGTSIFYDDKIVYLGLARATNGLEFFTINVSNPLNPVILDSFEVGHSINSIFVKDGYAYIASPHSTELRVLDVSNPANIFEPTGSGFNAPGGGGNNGNGKSIYIVGNDLYFGRTLLSGNEFYILDKSDPENNLAILGFLNVQNNGSNSSVNEIIVRQNLAFLITNEEFQIWDISNPSNITEYAVPIPLPPGIGTGLKGTAADCEGNYIFVGSQNSNNKGYISVITGGYE